MGKLVKNICAIDLFCGIGGLTHGLIRAGINVKVGVDNDLSCERVYRDNNPNAEFIGSDIRNITAKGINHYYKDADVKVLAGCAPCQPFSSHTNKQRKAKDKNFSLLLEFARLVEECQPDIVSIENVPGLLREEIFSFFSNTLKKMGYKGEPRIIFCPEYGVPQTRKRLVYLSSRIGEIDILPPPYPTKEQWPTVADFIKELPPVRHGCQSKEDPYHLSGKLTEHNLERIKQSRPGGDWRDWDERLISPCHRKAEYFAPYGRMRWDAPAPTITTQFCCYSTGRFGHPTQNRTITLREGALLQTFPKSYKLHNEKEPLLRTRVARHIGNAVPVKLGESIGISIKEACR